MNVRITLTTGRRVLGTIAEVIEIEGDYPDTIFEVRTREGLYLVPADCVETV